jgi:hypothetical protein
MINSWSWLPKTQGWKSFEESVGMVKKKGDSWSRIQDLMPRFQRTDELICMLICCLFKLAAMMLV